MSVVHADRYGDDLFTEPAGDPDTLANLGPLRALAGVWEGVQGDDVHPVADGSESAVFIERYELVPIDFQTNGPQIFYGLRYHTHINEVGGEAVTFHDQVGYWLWEPATNTVVHTLTIPRGQSVVAGGSAAADATEFEVTATVGSPVYGITAVPFIDRAFRTTSFRLKVVTGDDEWSYDSEAVLEIPDRPEPFLHTDQHTLKRVGSPSLNPLVAHEARPQGSLGIGDLRHENGHLL